jgi:hypothetical protein
MAATGLWNIGGINLPDFHISEALGLKSLDNPAFQTGITQGTQLTGSSQPVSAPQAQPLSVDISKAIQSGGLNLVPVAGGGPNGPSGQVFGAKTETAPQSNSGFIPPGWTKSDISKGSLYIDPSGKRYTWNGSNWDVTAAPQGPSDADINAVYDPLMKSLNDQASAYQTQYGQGQTAINDQYSQGVAGLNTMANDSYNQLNNQQTQASQDQATAYAKARSLYNELQQRNQAMFGGRSSAGQFAGELLGRETSQQMGQTTNQANEAKAAIEQERSRVGQWVKDQTNTWNQKKTSALDSLQNTFTQGLNQINAQKNQLESDKAQRRIELLQQAQAQVAQIQQADRAFQQQLALFQAQKESQLAQTPNTQNVYGQQPISTAPVILGTNGAQTIGENRAFSQSLRYVRQANGDVLDKITGQLIPASKFQQG